MVAKIGLRREDKNEWERRIPLAPADVENLIINDGLKIVLQPFPNRAFKDFEYTAVGAEIDENLSGCSVILGIKEMPNDFFKSGLTYVFFSHTIKGQDYNMPMLKKILETGCNLIDYEKITDDTGRRLVFFGREAGQAGMIDVLWTLGRRLKYEGVVNPFSTIKHAIEYNRLTEAVVDLSEACQRILRDGIPDNLHPLVVGFAGYGNVSNGAQEILGNLPVKKLSPEELLNPTSETFRERKIYQVVFKEEHMAEPNDPAQKFELQDYYDNPSKYHGVFEKYVPQLTVLMNCIYWKKVYPRLLTKTFINKLYSENRNVKLKVIGDISSDINGAVEITLKTTNTGNPVFTYDIESGEAVDGVEGHGPVVLAVDNLPCELPREASAKFSKSLTPFIPGLANADFSLDFDRLNISPELKRAIICYHGKLTPDYEYLRQYL